MNIEKDLKEIMRLAGDIVACIVKILDDIKQTRDIKTPIEELGLSSRATNCLLRKNIEYVEQIPEEKKELMYLRGIGEGTANEVLEKIADLSKKIIFMNNN